MTALILLIGVLLVVVAIHNTQGDLFGALATDVPPFFVWGAAVVAVAALGYVPGLKTASRWMLALIVVVLILHNYRSILSGFSGAIHPTATGSGGTSSGGASPTSGGDLSTLSSLLSNASASGSGSSFSSSEAA